MTGADATIISDDLVEAKFLDVWSQAGTKRRRRRAVVLLGVNLLLFIGACCFAFWLRTGEIIAPLAAGYGDLLGLTLAPRGPVTLSNFVLYPINVELVPMQGVVVGLLLASLVSIPILISILYRFWSSTPFILAVAFFAVMPWLAITLLGACILASVRPFRLNFRYASALLGLLLVLVYFVGASRESYYAVDMYKPEARIKFIAPWVLATLAACLIMGLVLFLSKLVNYRPGVVAPLLLFSFSIPVALFEKYVGRHELYYRLLESRVQETFRDCNVADWFERQVQAAWRQRSDSGTDYPVVRDNLETRLLLELGTEGEMDTVFAGEREMLVARCDWFIRQFPDSRYAPNVAYFKGQTLDMRVDLAAFRAERELRFYSDFPTSSALAELTWRMVLHNAPDSSVSALARYKLAILAARAERLEEAFSLLDDLLARYAPEAAATSAPAGSAKRVLDRKPADLSLKIPLERIAFEGRQLLGLLRANYQDPRYGLRPLCGSKPGEPRQVGFLQIDPHYPRFREQLLALAAAYDHCLLQDNLAMNAAVLIKDIPERVAALQDVLTRFPEGDARPETLLRLGFAYQEAGNTAKAAETLETLLRECPDSLWAPSARDRLRALTASATDQPRP